jgi:hypothetical protein
MRMARFWEGMAEFVSELARFLDGIIGCRWLCLVVRLLAMLV